VAEKLCECIETTGPILLHQEPGEMTKIVLRHTDADPTCDDSLDLLRQHGWALVRSAYREEERVPRLGTHRPEIADVAVDHRGNALGKFV
jgi:hypothetical protein